MDNQTSCRRSAWTLKSISSAILAVVPLALVCTAQQPAALSVTPGTTSSQVKINWAHAANVPIDGKQMYAAYCSPCHGARARGDGPAGAALQVKPTDLTTMQYRNQGKFPNTRLKLILINASNLPSKQAAQMPSWCPIFRDLDQGDHNLTALRVQSLLTYLQSLQVGSSAAIKP
jgi:hypothetical protein